MYRYFGDPEIPYPIKMWVDDVTLSYVPEGTDLTIDFLGFSPGDEINISRGIETVFLVEVTNNKSIKVCGTLPAAAENYFYAKLVGGGSICLNANSTQTFDLSINPQSNTNVGRKNSAGITFVNKDSIQSDPTSVNRSLTDANVEKRWRSETGAFDNIVSSNFIRLKIQ